MPLDGKAHATFVRRTGDIYRHQRERAQKHHAQLSYGLDQLRQVVMHRLAPPDGSPAPGCHYCAKPLPVTAFTMDHAYPVARGGAWDLSNLVVACSPCNEAKGALTAPEFNDLLELLQKWPPRVAELFLRRLRAGGKVIRCG